MTACFADNNNSNVTVASSSDAEVAAHLVTKLPNVTTDQIEPSPVSGIYSVDLVDKYAYVTADGKYLFVGELIDMETGLNHTQVGLGKKRVETIAAIDEKDFIVFPAKNKKHSITVFTDIDCTWCRRFHAEMDEYNELGIEVRYLLRPRSGQKSASWKKADSVFCSKNQHDDLTMAKQGKNIAIQACDKAPTKNTVRTAEKLGFMGTPVILSEGGQRLGGYVPAKTLIEKLDAEKAGI